MRIGLVVTILISCLIRQSVAQTTFFNTISPAGYLFSMKRISDGNFVFGNTATSTTTVIIKQDSLGQQIWNTEIPLASAFVYDIEEAADGGLLVLVHASFGPNTCPFIVRLKADGQLAWVKSYHNNSSDDVKEIIAMPDTGFVLTGSGCTGSNYLMRARKDGTLRWKKMYIAGNGGPGFNFVCLALTDNGTTLTVTGSDFNGDLILFKADTAGTALWLHTFPVVGTNEYVSAMVRTNDGVAVAFQCVQLFPASSYTIPGLARFDNAGNLEWMTQYTLPAQAWPGSLAQLSDHSFVIGGAMNNPLDSMSRRALLMGIDEFGQQQWTQAFSDSVYSDFGPQSVSGIIETAGQEMFVIGQGYTNFFGRFTTSGYGACSAAWFGPVTNYLQPVQVAAPAIYDIPVTLPEYVENPVCTYGIFISEFTSCTNVITAVDQGISESGWKFTSDGNGTGEISVPEFYQSKVVLVEITDITGRIIRKDEYNAPGGHFPVNAGNVESGEYFVTVTAAREQLFSSRMIVVH